MKTNLKKCPICNHKLYKGVNGISFCKNCPYVNKPNYIKICNARIKPFLEQEELK